MEMEKRNRTSSQGGHEQGTQKPSEGGDLQGGRKGQSESQKSRQGDDKGQSESEKPTVRPTPSGVPNEGRGAEDHLGSLDQGLRTGLGDNESRGGRQGPGEIPNLRK
jgi:hypothetical protein